MLVKGLKKVPLNGPQVRGKGLCWDYEYGLCPHDDEGRGCPFLHRVKGSAVIRCMYDEQGQYCPGLQMCPYEHHHIRNTNRLPWVWVEQAVWIGDSQQRSGSGGWGGVSEGYSHCESGLSGQFSGELEGRAPLGGIQEHKGLEGIKVGQSLSAEAPVFTGGASSEDNLATPGAVNDVEQDGGTIEGVESLQCPAVAEPKDHFGGSKFATCCFDQQQHDQ